jgi:hypothetical protein
VILYRILPDGGFVAGDTDTRRTAYAYPKSGLAFRAKLQAAKVAAEMVSAANAEAIPDHIRIPYDAANWGSLASGNPADLKSLEEGEAQEQPESSAPAPNGPANHPTARKRRAQSDWN